MKEFRNGPIACRHRDRKKASGQAEAKDLANQDVAFIHVVHAATIASHLSQRL